MAYDRLKGKKTLTAAGFLDEFEKDEVKKNIDIVSLFSSFGIKLNKKGKSYTGLCPWHDDKNPSPDCSTALGYCLSYSSLKSCGLVRSQLPEFADIKQFTITPLRRSLPYPGNLTTLSGRNKRLEP